MSLPLPRLSRKKRGWTSGDPPVAAGKSVSQRKSARDGGFTPTERLQKDKLMRQFQRMPEGQSGNSSAYVSSPLWCDYPGCKRTRGTHEHEDARMGAACLHGVKWGDACRSCDGLMAVDLSQDDWKRKSDDVNEVEAR